MMAVYHLTATVWQEGDQYVSRCPELGVASCGDTPDQALEELVVFQNSSGDEFGRFTGGPALCYG